MGMGDWNDGGSNTPPLTGFDTPSEPSPRDIRQPTYFTHQVMPNGCGVLQEKWDWNTEVPDFVPGGMSMKAIDPGIDNAFLPVVSAETYQAPRSMTNSTPAVDGGGPQLLQIHAHYKWQLQSKSDELDELRRHVSNLEEETARSRSAWEAERHGLEMQLGAYRAVLHRYCIPDQEAWVPPIATDEAQQGHGCGQGLQGPHGGNNICSGRGGRGFQWNGAGSCDDNEATSVQTAIPQANSLDSKMQQLNHLLQEKKENGGQRRLPQSNGDTNGVHRVLESGGGGAERHGAANGGAIASTLRCMFPHATIRGNN